jgi:hypothetical protein
MLTRRHGYPTIADPLAARGLSNDVRMSPASEDNGRSSSSQESDSVLANLPSARPQRSSARRIAAREAASGNGAAPRPAPRSRSGSRETTSAAARGPKVGSSAPGKQRSRRAPATARARPTTQTHNTAPMQGYECEGDRANGPVQPPGSSELAASAVELLGELAKAGFSTGERLFKDVLGRFPLS